MTSNYLPFEGVSKPAWNEFLGSVRAELAEAQPARVKPSETIVTTEALDVVYAIVPHDALGGFSLVAARTDEQTSLFWAAIRSLKYHDDLDMAWGQYTVWDSSHSPSTSLAEALRGEFMRPLRAYARVQRGQVLRLECELLGGSGNDDPQRVFGRMRSPLKGPVAEQTFETSLSAPDPPPLQCPPEVERWFGKGGRTE